MELILTGTGSPLPDANRAGPSTLVKAGDTHILVDAGRGVVMRMAGAGSLPGLLAGVLITHLHSDHICALNDVITTHWVVGGVQIATAATEHAPVRPTIGFRLEHDGSTAALVGDTVPCDGVDELARNADVYVQTVIRRDLVEIIPISMMQDILDYHSDVVEAAQTAERVGAKRLALTHMVPAPTPATYPEWVALVAEHYSGEVIIGDDLTTVTV